MATYGYEAINRDGKEVKGSVEADSLDLAKAELKKQSMTIISLSEQSVLTKDLNISIGGYPKTRDLSVFCRQFVSMVRSGVTILDALKMLGEQTENKRLRDAIIEIRVEVEKGETLAASMGKMPKIFPPIMVSMVDAGEASGNLDTSFDRIANQLERSSKTEALIKKAMIYPIVVACVSVAVIILMLWKIIPNYTVMFEDLGTDLPWITRMVSSASDFVVQRWYLIFAIIIGLVVGCKAFSKTDSGKHVFGKLSLVIPMFKDLTVKRASSQMARTLSTLMASGVPMVDAVDIVSRVMSNVWYREALQDVKSEVMLGVPISEPIEKSGLFPPMVYHMIHIGEESGDIEGMLEKIADYYDEEVEIAVQSLMAAMEPMIIIVLAIIVGTLIGAVMAPMVKMYEVLDTI